MFELGDDEKLLHAEVGEAVAKAGIDKLIAIGELSKNIYEKASEGGIDAHWFETKEEMLTKKDEIFKEGDTILIKASHGMDFAKLVDTFKED
jgi:UDP-N-acetylmuramoyl-tripeptide--D-alanyl-D-alanine ligase